MLYDDGDEVCALPWPAFGKISPNLVLLPIAALSGSFDMPTNRGEYLNHLFSKKSCPSVRLKFTID